MKSTEFITEEAKASKYKGLVMKYAFNDRALILKAFEGGNPIAYVKFVKENKELYPQDLWVNDDYRNKGVFVYLFFQCHIFDLGYLVYNYLLLRYCYCCSDCR